ncbi:transcription elongation factor S-II [Xylariaceae sp. FL0594]|nr:transcription elongation factor S-II [Xylariaceae sp. FL0594]
MSTSTQSPSRADLLNAAKSFCDCFAQKKPLEETLSHFSSPSPPSSGTPKDKERSEGNGDEGEEEQEEEEQEEILIHEHGLPQLAPFLGRDFRGLEGARRYFSALGKYLSYEDMRFVEFVVDAEAESDDPTKGQKGKEQEGGRRKGRGGKVAVRGKATFTWTETKQSWDETFLYVLRFDSRCKLTRYEVWADSGAAYLARRGELEHKGYVWV